MAAYGSGYFGGGNYSYGVSLGALTAAAQSAASIAGVRVVNGAFTVAASSGVSIYARYKAAGSATFAATSNVSASATRVAFVTATVASEAVMTVDSVGVFNGFVDFVGTSQTVIDSQKIHIVPIQIDSTSSVVIFGRKKWENEDNTPETWNPISDTPEIWTPISDTTENWQIAA
jgi:hypothetical protein